ncbi:MFS transporter [Nesterenkonia muleiensis]|uniref:MFS transporter n=1 Tax=Nesterenkonia muleiensis TaxID=2282648 RepID=UPI00192E3386|nr:MFS transporter [Nesterenkonia muleiensis]
MPKKPAPKAGFTLLTVLLGAVGAGPLLLYGLSATSDSIITELGIDAVQFGLLATVCFACAAVGNAALGRLADRRSDILLMSALFLLAAVALVLAGLPGGYALLLVAAGLSGIAQSFSNGVTNRILLERVPAAQRIGWVGIKQSGVQVSQLVASLAFPLLALWVGWRGAALVGSLIPFILLLLAWHALSSTPRLGPDNSPRGTTSTSSPPPLRPGLTRHSGTVWALAAFGLLNGIGVQATNVYLPLFAVRELGFSLVLGGATAAVAGVVGVAARVGWARVMARGASAPTLLLVLALTALAGAAAFLGAGMTDWAALLWLAVILHGASALGVAVVLMSALLRSTPASSMASVSGIVTAGMFAGFTLGPVGMGAIISSSGGFQLGWIAVGVVYSACTALALVLIKRTEAS